MPHDKHKFKTIINAGCNDMYLCNPATLEADFKNGVDSIPVGSNSPSIDR